MNHHCYFDTIIIGSGASGLSLALNLAKTIKVALIAKSTGLESSTYRAQGGIAAVLDARDTIDSHILDTLNAGALLNDKKAVEFTVENGKDAIAWLIDQGVPFDRKPETAAGDYHLTREGGHSHRRIIHIADATGKAVYETLISKSVKEPNLTIYENHTAIDLICDSNGISGAFILDELTGRIQSFKAKYTVIATGGASNVYPHNTNPKGNCGDGIAMAYRAGCDIVNMEFNQFHPTSLYHPQTQPFLISEAVRGEGGLLKLPSGERFMPRYDERAELAPRDIVARAIHHELQEGQLPCVYLDISHKPAEFIRSHFPSIYETCLSLGLDITREPIPVVPAAHYTCGGIQVNLNGETTIDGLLAIGEASHTGLHGANRLASNSLLECIVFALSASRHILANIDGRGQSDASDTWPATSPQGIKPSQTIRKTRQQIQQIMWDNAGILRNDAALKQALHNIGKLHQQTNHDFNRYQITRESIELRNLALVAELIIRSALKRKESRGSHQNTDHPTTLRLAEDTVLHSTHAADQKKKESAGR